MELRDALQHLALEMPSYGWRRITAELRRRSWRVNHKRVRRLMREDNLLCLRRRRFVLTTDSDHRLGVYPNLARELVLTQLDQLWVADLTYIRLEVEFVYLAVILDAFSRRVVGCALERTFGGCFGPISSADGVKSAPDQIRPGAPPIAACSTPAGTTPIC
jgi:transposase InsO family protein